MSTDSIFAEKIASPFHQRNYFPELPVSSFVSHGGDGSESSEIFSDLVLDLEYINNMLMEEDMDEKFDMLQGHPALEATEKPFYEIIGEKYPPSPDRPPLYSSSCSESSDGYRGCVEYQNSQFSPSSSSSSSTNGADGFEIKEDLFPDIFFKNLPLSQFEKGVEEAKKFLPSEDKLVVHAGRVDSVEREDRRTGRTLKNRHGVDDLNFTEGRISKQSAVSFEDPAVPSEVFDMVLLCAGEKFPKALNAIRENIYQEASKNSQRAERKKSGGRKNQWKKQREAEMVDINTLLLHCAQTVAAGDSRRGYELLKKIRQHSTPHGDAPQRVAHYFADGLEARLAGTGSEIYHSLVAKRKTAADVLKAYQLYLAACPFKKISYHFANQTILETIEKATRVHIVDFGIYFGFQWPVFIKLLSQRPGGPPKLRITGIDFPQPGFRPLEMIEETGRRLAGYAKRFGVPFEYQAVASKFEEIKIEDLCIKEDEMLVVSCVLRLHNLADETVVVDCPRDKVLRTIRELNPALFVNVVISGSYGAPFFVTRFREALYHFSALFDMLETNVPREDAQRLLVERNLYGRFAINVIACEGVDRVERPETFRQWQVRCLRAGFEQLPASSVFLKAAKHGVRSYYHKDFSIDEDGRWVLQGWKGRIIIGLSAWKPTAL
ncbi:Scarecrow-like protein 9 [Apostasia shenzhenica]|uniref:Scarecrow-like protein 9 n=1 Tax=Apostasia shenzhenica TaxID=1088818 RepID=A0A2I0B5R8_9ASPA|nr:Scarecrow-like protein 9 [Apostasia shenzhenica]